PRAVWRHGGQLCAVAWRISRRRRRVSRWRRFPWWPFPRRACSLELRSVHRRAGVLVGPGLLPVLLPVSVFVLRPVGGLYRQRPTRLRRARYRRGRATRRRIFLLLYRPGWLLPAGAKLQQGLAESGARRLCDAQAKVSGRGHDEYAK